MMRKKLMHEYSRILIEEYCFTRKTKKAEILSRLVEMSHDLSTEDADAIDLERLIQRERNPELKEALIDLDVLTSDEGWHSIE